MSPHSFTLPVLSLTVFTLLYDHTCIRNGQLAVTSQVAANFLPLDFRGSRHIKFSVSAVFCFVFFKSKEKGGQGSFLKETLIVQSMENTSDA